MTRPPISAHHEVLDPELSPRESHVTLRRLYPFSVLGLEPGRRRRTPKRLQLRIADCPPRVDQADFRDEPRSSNYPGATLSGQIHMAGDHRGGKVFADGKRIGAPRFSEDVVSRSGDGRLRFTHPTIRYRQTTRDSASMDPFPAR